MRHFQLIAEMLPGRSQPTVDDDVLEEIELSDIKPEMNGGGGRGMRNGGHMHMDVDDEDMEGHGHGGGVQCQQQ